ncbi:MAG TPA: hypothetical protein PKG54_03330 [Phycisphaerae bacterium]|jgi:hypothetical protein|nr:hypothetical protein [Phycisphaerae bacterium]HOB73537.1 hypothetical protein [Phycisphaerae bacterium]HOJ54145.1 hypothetical protein [Phycisphaerae bacterium]HOL25562.1 hypothetical protein [Phycisphaerae bacterium]HPP21005.1 hypothetical protein [Phycisphaerae bacterium]
MNHHQYLGVSLLIALCGGGTVLAQKPLMSANPGVVWPAVDALGRKLPTPGEVGPPRPNRFVGIFYFLWLNERHNRSPHWEGPYDIARILAADPDALQKPESPLWGKIGQSHYWGEPLYGYYLTPDPWVLRRHANLLADAGIDTLIFDTTNALTYHEQYMALCKVFRQIRQEGGWTPQFAFMVNTQAGKTARKIYDELYKPGLYPELWFHWQGKPLMICDPKEADEELKAFFTLRRAHWPFEIANTQNAWHWEAVYPQVYGYTDDPDKPEQVNVSVAQNLRVSDGYPTAMSYGDARGRSFHKGKKDPAPDAIQHGHNFAEQWQRAHELNPPFVMVTGWNEWIAGRWGDPKGRFYFVDQYDQEHSRDIEPMKGGHNDNYYWQMVAHIRRYKGAPPMPKASAPTTIKLDGRFEQWKDVDPTFSDHINETLPRDFDGAGGLRYENKTGRNDIVACKVARDAKNVYFYVRTREPLTPRSDPNWMWLFIDADQNPATGWAGYDFIVNRTGKRAAGSPEGEKGAVLVEKNAGGWNWQEAGTASCRVEGNQLHLAIPRSVLGLPENTTKLALDFKWADNLQKPGDVMDFYLSGDVAPEARFNYRYLAD